MKVYGYEIAEDVIEACFQGLSRRPTHWQVSLQLAKLGVPTDRHRAEEAANRLFQRWRREGRVSYSAKLGWAKAC